MKTIELTEIETRIILQLNSAIQELQGKLQIALAMAMAVRDVPTFTVHKIEGNKITIDDGTV
jgi:hypothetical protein